MLLSIVSVILTVMCLVYCSIFHNSALTLIWCPRFSGWFIQSHYSATLVSPGRRGISFASPSWLRKVVLPLLAESMTAVILAVWVSWNQKILYLCILYSPWSSSLPSHPPSVPVGCSATTSTTITRATAAVPSRSPSRLSVPCTSARRAPLAKLRAHPMRSSWTQRLSPLPHTLPQARTPTSTMPTTPAWPGSPPRESVDSQAHPSALWTGTRGSHSPPFCCQDPHGAFLQRGECRASRSLWLFFIEVVVWSLFFSPFPVWL